MLKLVKWIMKYLLTRAALRTVGSTNGKITVNFYSRFTDSTHIGKNCHFNGLIIRGNGNVTIGDNFHSGKNILFVNSYHKYDDADAIPYDTKVSLHKNIVIGDNVWLGDRVLILGGVEVGEGSIIQAGSVVVNNIPEFSIAGGNPARVFKTRNIEQYLKLKSEGKFC